MGALKKIQQKNTPILLTESKKILDEFIKTFFSDDSPFWHQVPKNSVEVNKDIFYSDFFVQKEIVYFFVRIEEQPLYSLTVKDSQLFFENQDCYEDDFDIYIFDSGLEWCIYSSSDEHADGFYIFYSERIKTDK